MLKHLLQALKLKPDQARDLDPLLKVLTGALAAELESLHNRLSLAEESVLERLSEFLVPDAYTGMQPAHSVLQVIPIEDYQRLDRYASWYYEYSYRVRSDSPDTETRRIAFTPAIGMEMIRGYSSVLSTTYQMLLKENEVDEYTIDKDVSFDLRHNELLLGLRLPDDAPEEIVLFLNWPDELVNERIYYHMTQLSVQNAAWEQTQWELGLVNPSADTSVGAERMMQILEDKVVDYYSHRFITLKNNGRAGVVPEELMDVSVPDDLTWFRFIFPSDLSATDLELLRIEMNIVPVINREIERVNFRISKGTNVKAIWSINQFLEIQSIVGIEDEEYIASESFANRPDVTRWFSIVNRSGARFNQNDAIRLLHQLQEAIMDEYSVFSSMNLEMVSDDLENIVTSIKRVQKAVPEEFRKGSTTYVSIATPVENDNVTVSFWTCSGLPKEGIATGTQLEADDPNIWSNGTGWLVNSPLGERPEPRGKQRIQLLRSSILSKGRLVTRNDIVERAKFLLGDSDVKMTVEPGVLVSDEKHKGLVRCLLIRIQRSKRYSKEDWEGTMKYLETTLKAEAAFVYPIKVVEG